MKSIPVVFAKKREVYEYEVCTLEAPFPSPVLPNINTMCKKYKYNCENEEIESYNENMLICKRDLVNGIK